MKNTSLQRTIVFEVLEGEDDIVFNYKFAIQNYGLKRRILENKRKLVQLLKVEDIVNVKIIMLDSAKSSDSNLRLYIYKTKNCNTNLIQGNDVSHAIQVSLGNGQGRSNWVAADGEFSAKVFPENEEKVVLLIEDIVLDIQMFYYWGYDRNILEVQSKREFSKEKVLFLSKKNLKGYLGSITGSEYVSFASFARDDNGNLDFDLYINLWREFVDYMKNNITKVKFVNEHIYSNEDIQRIINEHPKGRQLSLKKIKRMLHDKPKGMYILTRTETKPKNFKERCIIENKFGMMGKWKTGKLKIVDYKHRFTYQKMQPYVSLYEFEWKG